MLVVVLDSQKLDEVVNSKTLALDQCLEDCPVDELAKLKLLDPRLISKFHLELQQLVHEEEISTFLFVKMLMYYVDERHQILHIWNN